MCHLLLHSGQDSPSFPSNVCAYVSVKSRIITELWLIEAPSFCLKTLVLFFEKKKNPAMKTLENSKSTCL